jgi:hypothetical protein
LRSEVFKSPPKEMGAAEPNERFMGKAKVGKASRKAGLGLVRIFTQRRRAAEMLRCMSDCILRDDIFGGPFYA